MPCCPTDSSIKPIERSFEALLSFEQVLIPSGTAFIPFSQVQTAPLPRILGRFRIKFSRDFSFARYRLEVFGLPLSSVPGSLFVTSAGLFAGRPFQNGPLIVPLFNAGAPLTSGLPGVTPIVAQVTSNGVISQGTLTNTNINPVTSPNGQAAFNTIASLLDGIRRGEVYCQIFGTNAFSQGLARGQLLVRDTTA